MEVHPVTEARLADLARLFRTTAMTNRCYCTWFLLAASERERQWRAGNARAIFERLTVEEAEPTGVLAYRAGEPVGWCAVGPRARYPSLLRSPLWKERDPAQDTRTWVVTCFYVHRDARHAGLTGTLLDAAVAVAAEHGAEAVEGMPRVGGDYVSAVSSFVGFEQVFADAGFAVVRRPSPTRVLMRLPLAG